MRIAFASDSAFPWFNGGIEKRRFIIMRKLAQNGNNVHCFTMHRDGMPGWEFIREGIRYHCVSEAASSSRMYKGTGRRSSMMPLRFGLSLFTKILPYRFDAMDADSFPFLHLFPIYLYTRIRGVRFAVTWHEVWSLRFWLDYLGAAGIVGYIVEWLCSRMPDVSIANTSTTRGLLTDVLGVRKDRVMLFPVAVDSEEIKRFSAPAGTKKKKKKKKKDRFIVISRLVKHKRVELAIRAIAETNSRLLVVGVGPQLQELETLAERIAPGRVSFERRALSTERLYRELSESLALIMPSEREGLSLVTIEALAFGVPVVIADTSSLPKEIRGMCIEAEEERMGDLLKDISANGRAYARRSGKLKARALREFSADNAQKIYGRLERF